MDMGLKNKVAVVTGSSVGIGLAVAEGLAREGAHIVMVARDKERLESAAGQLAETHGVRCLPVSADVATAKGVESVVRQIDEAFGGADILINNAGTGSNETIMEAPDDKWQFYWELHVMAAVRLARGLVPGMKKRGGGCHHPQCVDLRRAASVVRANLQRHQSCSDDVLQDARD